MAETLEATLRRLKDERDEADRRYNDALTALDKSFRGPSPLPAIPPGQDDHQITPLNQSWNILPATPEFAGPAGTVKGFIWRVVSPFFQRQLTFNSQLVDHLNRNLAAQRASQQAMEETFAALNTAAAVLAEFQSRLLVFLQQITAFVDTKDRDHASRGLVLNAALSAMGDRFLKHWESLSAGQARLESLLATRSAEIKAEQQNLRTMVGIAQQAALTAKREIERRESVQNVPQARGGQRAQEAGPERPSRVHGALDGYKYVGFENEFRGSREIIRERLEAYLPHFEGTSDVLDVGCGRGEFLDLLKTRGINGRGVDVNHEMVEECRARGLDVDEGDAVSYVERLGDATLGGLIAVQVVEHLEPDYLLQLLELAFHKLRPGAPLILETLNPACWLAFFESYIRDVTHRWPLHPETLKYFVLASGFASADIEWRAPVPEIQRLQPIKESSDENVGPRLLSAFNTNVDKLNARMFTFMDYAIIGKR